MAFLRRRERKSTAGLNTLLNRIQKKLDWGECWWCEGCEKKSTSETSER